MQEIHSIGGDRFLGGGGGSGGERRLRPHQHQNHQALKCPRCDSLNTKFCYYNNYNLSQPRHFCKSCRRYWTKGGVLRNVPVGGGCRKSKRSRAKNSSSENRTSSPVPPATATTAETVPAPTSSQKKLKSNSHSSSESSSLTAANTASAATEAMSAPNPDTTTNNLRSMQESKLFVNNQSGVAEFESGLLEQGAESGIFSEIGNLSSWITSTGEASPFAFGNISHVSPFRFCQQSSDHLVQSGALHDEWPQQQKWTVGNRLGDQHPQDLKFPQITGGSSLLDQPIEVDFSSALQTKTANGSCFGSLDWEDVGDQGLFDFPNTVDQTYWSQTQWTGPDNNSLYLP